MDLLVAQLFEDSGRHVEREHVPQVLQDELVIIVGMLEWLLRESQEHVALKEVERGVIRVLSRVALDAISFSSLV